MPEQLINTDKFYPDQIFPAQESFTITVEIFKQIILILIYAYKNYFS